MSRQSTEERRLQIAEAALKVIAEQGLGRFTTAAIAREVGLTDGALFRHFSSKDAIVEAAMERVDALLFDAMPAPEGAPLDRLGELVRQRSRVVSEHPFIGRLLLSDDLAHAGPRGEERVMQWRMRTLLVVRECLEEARERGEVRADLPLEHLLLIFQGTLLGSLVLLTRFEGSGEDLPALAQHVFQTFLALIRS